MVPCAQTLAFLLVNKAFLQSLVSRSSRSSPFVLIQDASSSFLHVDFRFLLIFLGFFLGFLVGFVSTTLRHYSSLSGFFPHFFASGFGDFSPKASLPPSASLERMHSAFLCWIFAPVSLAFCLEGVPFFSALLCGMQFMLVSSHPSSRQLSP